MVGACAALMFSSISRADFHDRDSEPRIVVIPGTAGEGNPVRVGKVRPGQTVTLHIGRVMWGGSGTEGRKQVNYRGYPNRKERNGLPWMALVVGVNQQLLVPDKRDYSFVVKEEGDLVLFANDDNSKDNTGQGEVTVTISDEDKGHFPFKSK